MDIVGLLGGKTIHPVGALPGGVSKAINEEERASIEATGHELVEFGQFSLQLFKDVVLGNKAYLDLILSDAYTTPMYYMGLVDENNKVNFYDGKVRVVDPEGKEFVKYSPAEYLDVVAEHVEPWTYLKFPYLKKVGWKGFVTGKDSGVYQATPLSRLNAADGMATPQAQEAYEEFYATHGRQAGARHAGHPLGAAHRAALRRRAPGRAGHRSRDHRPARAQHPHRDADRGRGHRRGAARHADPPLYHRRAGHRPEVPT